MIPFLSFDITILTAFQSMIGVFLSTALIQSGMDKIIDRKGNLEWLDGHFSKSILKGTVPVTLSLITVFEISGGALCAGGAILNLFGKGGDYLILGLIVSGLNFMALFFGQRIAKDYEGAAVIVGYFILTMLALLSFTTL